MAGAFLCGGGVGFIRKLGRVIRRFLDDIRGNGRDTRSFVNLRGGKLSLPVWEVEIRGEEAVL